jgi:8-amino-7-oxononanoate synthase
MTSPLDWIDDELARLDREGLLRRIITHEGPQGPIIRVGDEELINFGANDYLALAADERLRQAAREAINREGFGAGASPLVTGHSASHARLERRLAEFEGTDAALLFPSGFAANAGTVAALVDRGDCIFGDQKNHASLIDGCRLSRAEVFVYRHGDTTHLGELLKENRSYRRRLIVTDSLFSMDGDFAPLREIAALKHEHGCMLLVDEAHATGVFGDRGRGVCELLGVEDSIDIRVGTLSKALGCSGGFVAGSSSLIQWLHNRARPYVFSTAHPAAIAAAALAALEIAEREPQRRSLLLERAHALRAELRKHGWNLGRSESQIVPIYIGGAARAMQLAARLREQGLFVPGIRPPSVPEGESLLRISLSYGHTPAMIERLTTGFAALIETGGSLQQTGLRR